MDWLHESLPLEGTIEMRTKMSCYGPSMSRLCSKEKEFVEWLTVQKMSLQKEDANVQVLYTENA